MKRFLWVCFSLLWLVSAHASAPMPADRAFDLQVRSVSPEQLVLTWRLASGIRLYQKSIQITAQPTTRMRYHLPKAQQSADTPAFYSDRLVLPLVLQDPPAQFQLTVRYQGCLGHQLCYAPMQKVFALSQVQGGWQIALQGAHSSTSPQDASLSFAKRFGGHILGVMLSFLGLGLLLSFTPCVLPMLPITCALILGDQQQRSTWRAFALSLTYVVSMAFTYALAGVLAAHLGSTVQSQLQKPWLLGAFALLCVGMAGALLGWYTLRLPSGWHNRLSQWSNRGPAGTYWGVAVTAVIATLVVSPCVSAPLVGALTYIGTQQDPWLGGAALFVMGLGMGVPIVVVNTVGKRYLPRSGPWMQGVQQGLGIGMGLLALWFLRMYVSEMLLFTVGMCWVAYALWLWRPQKHASMVWYMVLLGAAWVGVLVSVDGWLYQRPSLTERHAHVVTPSDAMTKVYTLEGLNHAQRVHRASPVIIDFYASWCTSCQAVSQQLERLTQHYPTLRVIQVDISEQDADNRIVQKKYHVFAPPVLILLKPHNHGHHVFWQRFEGEPSYEDLQQSVVRMLDVQS